ARDELVPGALREAPAVLGIEAPHPGREGSAGGGPSEDDADLLDDGGEADRVEPDVRVGLPRFAAGVERLALENVERLSARAPRGVRHRGLEAVREVEHDVGALDLRDVPRRQL